LLARHRDAMIAAMVYAGVTEDAKAQIASKLTATGFGA
jgi:hypothetical protein